MRYINLRLTYLLTYLLSIRKLLCLRQRTTWSGYHSNP